jgi:hypothetical protein
MIPNYLVNSYIISRGSRFKKQEARDYFLTVVVLFSHHLHFDAIDFFAEKQIISRSLKRVGIELHENPENASKRRSC